MQPAPDRINLSDDTPINVQDLRQRLVVRLAWLVMLIASLAILVGLALLPASHDLLTLALAVFGVSLSIWFLHERHAALACHVLVWSLTATVIVAMPIFAEPWLPLLAVPIVFIGAVLVSNGELLVAALVGGATAWFARAGDQPYPILGIALVLVASVGAARLTANVMVQALKLAWTMKRRADESLAEAQNRQADLAGALKSLELATYQLETANRKLIIARRQTEEARRAKEQFAANISHELRTPLNVILGFSEMMYVSPEVYGDVRWPTPLRQDVYQIFRNSRHLLAMIDDVLELSRFELADFSLRTELTDIGPLVNSAVDIVRGLFRDRPIKLEVDAADGLPAVDIDRTRIRQVIINLLTNARNHTQSGCVRVEARAADGGEIIISVADTGPGIPADKVARIFDAFFQIDNAPRVERGGTGLGLAISKQFVEAHEGRIWVDSRQGAGTTVSFSLPVPDTGTRTVYPVETQSRKPAGPEDHPKVLVVDADPGVTNLLRRHLAACDVIQISDAGNLTSALSLHQPRAVVRNVQPRQATGTDGNPMTELPGQAGLQRPQANIDDDAPTFIECSLPSRAWIAADLRVAACLTKPVTAEQLHAEIERLGDVQHILVVDDDRGFSQLVERMLAMNRRNYHVRMAFDGAEGLAAMRERRPDLVLLDLAMPLMNGFQVLDAMKNEPALADIPVVLLTVTSYAEDVLRMHGGRMVVERPGGVNLRATLGYLQAIIGTPESHAPPQLLQRRQDRVPVDRFAN